MSNISRIVQTTGYTWDGDLQEFNSPVSKKWKRGFYATWVCAVSYWIFYPAWPLPNIGYTTGVFNRIHYHVREEQVTSHWNSRAWLLSVLEKKSVLRQQEYFQQMELPAEKNQELLAFASSFSKVFLQDHCLSCHLEGWRQGLTLEEIQRAIVQRHSWNLRLSDSEIKTVALYLQHNPKATQFED
ncbi:hypothetical protein CCP3SC1AL1_540012 [Gammaproteobacteria bacterium]